MDIVIEARAVVVLCVLGFVCLSGLCSAVVISGMFLSKRGATWEDEDDIQG